MEHNTADIVMNPIRLRIIQYLAIHKEGTTSEIRGELSDIPQASLYRHIKLLVETNWIKTVKETKQRGAVEKTYSLSEAALNSGNLNPAAAVQNGIISLLASFHAYFENPENDPRRDMLTFATSTLMLTDEEYMEFLKSVGELIGKVIQNPPDEQRKPRRFTIISSPNEEK